MFEELINLSKDELLKLLAVIVLSDGTLRWDKVSYIRLSTSLNSESQHKLFSLLCFKLFNKKPNSCIITNKFLNKKFLQSTFVSKDAVQKLLKLSPSYKTTSGKQTNKEFLNSPQPNLNFLFDSSNNLKWTALRIWFDFDGSITPCFKLRKKRDIKKNKFYNYYQVQFECEIRISETNPNLVNELVKLCGLIGLKAIIKKKNNWSGIDGICISERKSVIKFLNYGPFTDVKISGKSNRFKGITKKQICFATRKIFDNQSIVKSKYFKNEKEAFLFRENLNNLLMQLAKS